MRSFTVTETKNYDIFDLHENNRVVKVNSKKYKDLMRSMKAHGFLPFFPLWVKKGKSGKLEVQVGHHRLHSAIQLGIPVFYMLYHSDFKIWEEEESTSKWTLADHFTRLISEGDHNALAIKNFHDETGIGLSLCLSLFSGETSARSNKSSKFKRGEFKVSPSTLHKARVLKSVVEKSKVIDKAIALHPHYVSALMKTMSVSVFDPDLYENKLEKHPALFIKQVNTEGYIEMIDAIYNSHTQRAMKIPLSFLVKQEMKARSPILYS